MAAVAAVAAKSVRARTVSTALLLLVVPHLYYGADHSVDGGCCATLCRARCYPPPPPQAGLVPGLRLIAAAAGADHHALLRPGHAADEEDDGGGGGGRARLTTVLASGAPQPLLLQQQQQQEEEACERARPSRLMSEKKIYEQVLRMLKAEQHRPLTLTLAPPAGGPEQDGRG
eukprot:SAG25_NODE_657_length_6115_cov_3.658411_5_plen_173_part_00